MMRIQTNESKCPLIQAVFPFTEEKIWGLFSLSIEGNKKMADVATDSAIEVNPLNDRRPYHSTSETPLWASLTAVRSAMGKRYPWKKELEKVMCYRSVFICAAMLSMFTLAAMTI